MIPLASSDIITAVFGLVGVVTGAVVSAVASLWSQRRREKVERKADERSQRAAIRLLDEEISVMGDYMRDLPDRWEVPPTAERAVQVWESERRVLALAMTDAEQFRIVSRGFLAVGILQRSSVKLESQQILPEHRASIESWQQRIEAARRLLDGLGGN